MVCVACGYVARMLGCESDGNAGVGSGGGVVAVSAYMGCTRGSGDLSRAGDWLEMSVVRGVGGVCDMCMCLARGGRCWGQVGDWLGFGLYQFWRNMGRVCLCFGCGGVGGIGGECVVGLGQCLVGCYVCVCCESGFTVLMAGPGICGLC